jgi:hypothetical protein
MLIATHLNFVLPLRIDKKFPVTRPYENRWRRVTQLMPVDKFDTNKTTTRIAI